MRVLDIHKSECIEEIDFYGEDVMFGVCPSCEELVMELWCSSYCGDCGQKIEWE